MIDRWDGWHACHLQAALRDTQESFGARLDAATRTVAHWHQHPETVPQPHLQQRLDAALAAAPPDAVERFAAATDPRRVGPAQAFTVAITVVVRDGEVLLVKPVDRAWQFPAGMVKPEQDSAVVAERETAAETGIHCRVVGRLGDRIHPVTGVHAEYFQAVYLGGEPVNGQPAENDSVTWAPIPRVFDFVDRDLTFDPVRTLLEDDAHGRAHA
jgi:8-oxo-dGTP diphosphatase